MRIFVHARAQAPKREGAPPGRQAHVGPGQSAIEVLADPRQTGPSLAEELTEATRSSIRSHCDSESRVEISDMCSQWATRRVEMKPSEVD